MTDAEILERAADRLEKPGQWCTGTLRVEVIEDAISEHAALESPVLRGGGV